MQLVNYVTPFIVLLYLTRILGINVYGVVAFTVSVTQLALVVLDFGFTLSATQKIAVWRDNKPRVARLIGAVFLIKAIGLASAAIAFLLYAAFTTKYAPYAPIFVLALLPLAAQCFQPTFFFAAIERMRDIAIYTVTAKVLAVLLVVFLVKEEADYLWVPIADGTAHAIALVLAFRLLGSSGFRVARPSRRDLAYTAKMTSGFFVSRLASTAYSSTGVLLLGLAATPAAVAVYSLAEQGYRALQSVFFPITQSLYPFMAKERDLRFLARVTAGCVAVALTGAVAGFILVPRLLQWLFAPEWAGATSVIEVFLVTIVVHVLTVLAGYPLAAAVRRFDVANRSVIYGAGVYAVGAAALISTEAATPLRFAVLLTVAEAYVLVHRLAVLVPAALALEKTRNTGRDLQ
jgi:polysaccharide transporter, PST family